MMKRRLIALLVDIFMIYTPIVYVAYGVLGGAQDFRQNQLAIFICFMLYAVIVAAFLAISGQTPGLRYVRLRVVGNLHEKIGFVRAFVRVVVWALSCALVVGFIVPFMSKRRACLHDICMKTRVISLEQG